MTATATFTFTGTGVDVYSRTNLETGLIMASIYRGEVAEGLPLRTLVIDNFAYSGDYYMIPTLSTIRQSVDELAEQSIRLLQENMETHQAPRYETVPVAVELRESIQDIQ